MQNFASCSQLLRRPSALLTRCAVPWPEVVAGGSITFGEGSGSCGATQCVRGRHDTEMREDEGCDVDDAPGRALDVDEQERHLRVAGDERAVRATSDMVAAAEIGELVALRRRDEDLAGVRVRKSCPGALERVRMVENRGIARQREQAS